MFVACRSKQKMYIIKCFLLIKVGQKLYPIPVFLFVKTHSLTSLIRTQISVNRKLLSLDDEKAVNYASMVLHTLLDETKVEELAKPQNIEVALRVMELCRTQPEMDWT